MNLWTTWVPTGCGWQQLHRATLSHLDLICMPSIGELEQSNIDDSLMVHFFHRWPKSEDEGERPKSVHAPRSRYIWGGISMEGVSAQSNQLPVVTWICTLFFIRTSTSSQPKTLDFWEHVSCSISPFLFFSLLLGYLEQTQVVPSPTSDCGWHFKGWSDLGQQSLCPRLYVLVRAGSATDLGRSLSIVSLRSILGKAVRLGSAVFVFQCFLWTGSD